MKSPKGKSPAAAMKSPAVVTQKDERLFLIKKERFQLDRARAAFAMLPKDSVDYLKAKAEIERLEKKVIDAKARHFNDPTNPVASPTKVSAKTAVRESFVEKDESLTSPSPRKTAVPKKLRESIDEKEESFASPSPRKTKAVRHSPRFAQLEMDGSLDNGADDSKSEDEYIYSGGDGTMKIFSPGPNGEEAVEKLSATKKHVTFDEGSKSPEGFGGIRSRKSTPYPRKEDRSEDDTIILDDSKSNARQHLDFDMQPMSDKDKKKVPGDFFQEICNGCGGLVGDETKGLYVVAVLVVVIAWFFIIVLQWFGGVAAGLLGFNHK